MIWYCFFHRRQGKNSIDYIREEGRFKSEEESQKKVLLPYYSVSINAQKTEEDNDLELAYRESILQYKKEWSVKSSREDKEVKKAVEAVRISQKQEEDEAREYALKDLAIHDQPQDELESLGEQDQFDN